MSFFYFFYEFFFFFLVDYKFFSPFFEIFWIENSWIINLIIATIIFSQFENNAFESNFKFGTYNFGTTEEVVVDYEFWSTKKENFFKGFSAFISTMLFFLSDIISGKIYSSYLQNTTNNTILTLYLLIMIGCPVYHCITDLILRENKSSDEFRSLKTILFSFFFIFTCVYIPCFSNYNLNFENFENRENFIRYTFKEVPLTYFSYSFFFFILDSIFYIMNCCRTEKKIPNQSLLINLFLSLFGKKRENETFKKIDCCESSNDTIYSYNAIDGPINNCCFLSKKSCLDYVSDFCKYSCEKLKECCSNCIRCCCR